MGLCSVGVISKDSGQGVCVPSVNALYWEARATAVEGLADGPCLLISVKILLLIQWECTGKRSLTVRLPGSACSPFAKFRWITRVISRLVESQISS